MQRSSIKLPIRIVWTHDLCIHLQRSTFLTHVAIHTYAAE